MALNNHSLFQTVGHDLFYSFVLHEVVVTDYQKIIFKKRNHDTFFCSVDCKDLTVEVRLPSFIPILGKRGIAGLGGLF